MRFVSALLLFVSQPSIAPSDYQDFLSLTQRLDQVLEWIDDDGMQTLTKAQARQKLLTLSSGLSKDQIKLKHSSRWKNGQRFCIIHLIHGRTTYRLYFQCTKDVDEDELVTKIKVSMM